jgi:energy-coupling factor transporter ATP-binding protein EcfA2
MDAEVTVSNYRCFSDKPVGFTLKGGLQSFVGVNNSGKSCLLRLFYELRSIFTTLSTPEAAWQMLQGQSILYQPMPMVKDQDEIFCDRNSRDLTLAFDLPPGPPRGAPMPSRFEIVLARTTKNWALNVYVSGSKVTYQGLNARRDGPEFVVFRPAQNNQIIFTLSPIVEVCNTCLRMLYIGPFRNAVNVGGSGDYYDMQIGQPFITSWRTLKTGYLKKNSEATYRLTEDVRRIFGFRTLDINSSDDGQNLLLTIDGKTYKQTEIGSGLIQFILVFVNAAVKQPSYVLIDEPELNLHPSLQTDFLTALASYAELGVLFATHSLGLARAVSDRVYSVRRAGLDDREVRDFTGTKALAEFLGELGFNAYQDLGFETVLLVEGPTDVTCVQQFLRHYGREHQVVLLQLGGRSMINGSCEQQLSEVKRISTRVYALVDSERSAPSEALAPDRQGFTEVCSKLNIPCHVLERRAIENYLPEAAIKQAKSDKYRALGPFELLKDAVPAWGKEENWRIARLTTKNDLTGTDLGTFLGSL